MTKRNEMIASLSNLSLDELMKLSGTRISYADMSSRIIPIRTVEELNSGFIYSQFKDKNYRDSIAISKNLEIPAYNFSYASSNVLKDKLLSFCGNAACIIEPEEDFQNIMNYGQFWFGKSAKMKKGARSQCHRNSCELWKNNRHLIRICTGYALSEDGIWRVHSWLIRPMPASNQIIETTVKRVAYFGFVMDDTVAEEFCFNNL